MSILEAGEKRANLTIEIPAGVLAAIVHDNISWDEAHTGFWCRFSCQPDGYHTGFWRLLQSPYFGKPAELLPRHRRDTISASRAIAGVLERYGPPADRVIRRYGLYCVGCKHSTADTLAHAAEIHGVGDDQLARLICELNDVAAQRARF